MSAPGDLRLLRHVPGTTPVHRLWAGTKLLVVAAISIAVVARPDWSSLAIAAGVVAAAALIARLPIGAAPKPPSWLVGLFLLGGAFALFAGGEPYVHIGAQTIGLGGAIDWLRFTILGLVVLGLAVVLTATTPVADLPEALGRLLGPLRRLRVPVDELVAAITLSVRCLPMLISELQTLLAAWRLRRPSQPTTCSRPPWPSQSGGRWRWATPSTAAADPAPSPPRACGCGRRMSSRSGSACSAPSPSRSCSNPRFGRRPTGNVITP
jgi:hypothetical protein